MEKDQNASKAPSANKNIPEPIDPSNTNGIGQNVEQGVVGKKEGIEEQSSEWEQKHDAADATRSMMDDKADDYIKNPSPEAR